MITIKWGLWSDLHRRIAVYETAPVASEAQRRDIYDLRFAIHDLRNWCSHVDLHHELPPSQSGVQKLITP